MIICVAWVFLCLPCQLKGYSLRDQVTFRDILILYIFDYLKSTHFFFLFKISYYFLFFFDSLVLLMLTIEPLSNWKVAILDQCVKMQTWWKSRGALDFLIRRTLKFDKWWKEKGLVVGYFFRIFFYGNRKRIELKS